MIYLHPHKHKSQSVVLYPEVYFPEIFRSVDALAILVHGVEAAYYLLTLCSR
jgi:hypothetical protein